MELLARHNMLRETIGCDPSIEACQSGYSEAESEDPKASDLLNLTLTLPFMDLLVPYVMAISITLLVY